MNKKTEVHIPENTDMNNGLPPETSHTSSFDFPDIPNEVFDDLPQMLRQACEKMKAQAEKEVFLLGAMGVLSGIMPNVQGRYFGRDIEPNLYCFILGKYGSGKGALLWARDMAMLIEKYKQELAKKEHAEHSQQQAQYQRQLRLYDKGKLSAPPEQPNAPRHHKLFLPANSSKTAVMQLLQENNGRGIIFETEGDTLADMLRQDYGNFSDVLRKAFHHEPVSYFRRANNEDVNIDQPCLSVVMSGTMDQLRKLIPTIENGLFSRFCFYILQGQERFKNPFDTEKDDYKWYFNLLADKLLGMYKKLAACNEPITFRLSPAQIQKFVRMFDEQKTELTGEISQDLEGTVNRLGVICFRVAMILTVLRNIDNINRVATLLCTDTDFDNAVAITEHLMQYSLHVYEELTVSKIENIVLDDKEQEEMIKECCRNHSMGVSYRGISRLLFGTIKKSSTIQFWINRHCKRA